jgi:four helix bundle protein
MKKFTISRQLLRSGTSVGANIYEAQNAESRIDFIHKMKVAAKEADECRYWLLLCKHSVNYPSCLHLISSIDELIKILSKIISSSKKKL